MKSWFRKAEDVKFDIGVSHRKYYKYGTNLIGLEHGDGAKMDALPLLMAQENPKDWSSTTHRYWYLHHIHHKVKHSRKGFTGTPKACEGFIHHNESGQVARLTHYF